MDVRCAPKTAKRASAGGKRFDGKKRHSTNDGGMGVGVHDTGMVST